MTDWLFTKCVKIWCHWRYIRLSLFAQAASMLLCRTNVYKQNNCVCRVVISKMLFQHDIHSYCIYKQRWPDELLILLSLYLPHLHIFFKACGKSTVGGCLQVKRLDSYKYHSRCASQRSWSRRTIPNEHGRRQDCGFWLHILILNILCWLFVAMFVGENPLANRWLPTLLLFWLDVRSVENIAVYCVVSAVIDNDIHTHVSSYDICTLNWFVFFVSI